MQKTNIETFDWALLNNHLYYDFNFFRYAKERLKDEVFSSSFIFLKAIEHLNFNNNLNRDLDLLKKFNRKDLSIWGIRKESNIYTVEYYFFYPKKYTQNRFEKLIPFLKNYNSQVDNISVPEDAYLISINPEDNEISSFEYYLPQVDDTDELFEIQDLGFYFKLNDPVLFSTKIDLSNSQKVVKNTYFSFYSIRELAKINKKLISIAKELFPHENPHLSLEYLNLPFIFNQNLMIHPSSIKIKDTNVIGLYFADVSIDSFFEFLKYNEYKDSFVQELHNNIENILHLQFDIGIDFILENGKFNVLKSAFWGSI